MMWLQPEAQDYIPAGVRNLRDRWRDFWHRPEEWRSSAQLAAALDYVRSGQLERYGAGPDPRRTMTDTQARTLLAGGGIIPTERRRK